MNIFEKPDETTRGNIKGFSEIGIKIHRAFQVIVKEQNSSVKAAL